MANPDWWEAVTTDVDHILNNFTVKLEGKLKEEPKKILMRKNPFLFRIRNANNVDTLSKMAVDAFLSSSEETIFGNVLEDIVVSICYHAKGGMKSATDKIDLEYVEDETHTLISIKSGINWGNSSQHESQRRAFVAASKRIRQSGTKTAIRLIEGCCYGPSGTTDRGTHIRIVGNEFWKEISDWDNTMGAVMDLIGEHAKNGLKEIREESYGKMGKYIKSIGASNDEGVVLWHKLLNAITQDDGETGK